MAVTLTSMLAPEDRAASPSERTGRLYACCRDDVFAYVATLLRDTALAEEVTATAFERAFRRRRLFDARRGSERAWLFAIARNAALDELRRRRRSSALLEDVPDVEAQVEEDHSYGAVRRATLQASLATLSPRERELIAMKFHAGLPNAEIARVLGVSESNAGTLLHRAITKLREACDEQA